MAELFADRDIFCELLKKICCKECRSLSGKMVHKNLGPFQCAIQKGYFTVRQQLLHWQIFNHNNITGLAYASTNSIKRKTYGKRILCKLRTFIPTGLNEPCCYLSYYLFIKASSFYPFCIILGFPCYVIFLFFIHILFITYLLFQRYTFLIYRSMLHT